MKTYKDECLVHFGVPGMKWGHRKARISSSGNRSRGSGNNKSPQQVKAARKSKLKTAAKVGAGLAAGALAAYGASKLIKNKNMKIQIEKGEKAYNDIIKQQSIHLKSATTFSNGTTRIKTKAGSIIETTDGLKTINKHNASVANKAGKAYNSIISKGSKMNTREAAKNVVNYYRKKKR